MPAFRLLHIASIIALMSGFVCCRNYQFGAIMADMENRHHVIFPASSYGRGSRKALRGHPLTIVKLDTEVHKELHADMREYEYLSNPSPESVTAMLGLARFYEHDHGLQPSPSELLGALASAAERCGDTDMSFFLKTQIPYILDGNSNVE